MRWLHWESINGTHFMLGGRLLYLRMTFNDGGAHHVLGVRYHKAPTKVYAFGWKAHTG